MLIPDPQPENPFQSVWRVLSETLRTAKGLCPRCKHKMAAHEIGCRSRASNAHADYSFGCPACEVEGKQCCYHARALAAALRKGLGALPNDHNRALEQLAAKLESLSEHSTP